MDTIYDILEARYKDDSGIVFILDEAIEKYVSNKDIYNNALKVLYDLQAKGISAGKELVLAVEDTETYLTIFWACIIGGIRVVPVSTGNKDQHRKKIFWIIDRLNTPFFVTSEKNFEVLKKFASENNLKNELEDMNSRTLLIEDIGKTDNLGIKYTPETKDIAFIIFTSGSTGNSKGFGLTHENVMASINASNERFKINNNDVCLNWTPTAHGMGLILYYLASLAVGAKQYEIPTETFMVNPSLWLEKTTQHKATVLYTTNSACIHLMNCIDCKKENKWNLESVRLICNGGEPLTQEVCEEFLDQMKKYGLKRNAMRPGYGIGEASVAACFTMPDEKVKYVHIDRNSVSIGKSVKYLHGHDFENKLTLVNLGPPVMGLDVRIRNQDGCLLEENHVGYIEIKGKNVTQSYYNNTDETEKWISRDGWLNTGDIGFIQDGGLVFFTRTRDLITVGDKVYSPCDIENIAEKLDYVIPRTIIVSGHYNKELAKNEIVLFIQNRRLDEIEFEKYAERLKKDMEHKTGLMIHNIIQVRQIHRTTSGKEQRFKLLEQYNLA